LKDLFGGVHNSWVVYKKEVLGFTFLLKLAVKYFRNLRKNNSKYIIYSLKTEKKHKKTMAKFSKRSISTAQQQIFGTSSWV